LVEVRIGLVGVAQHFYPASALPLPALGSNEHP